MICTSKDMNSVTLSVAKIISLTNVFAIVTVNSYWSVTMYWQQSSSLSIGSTISKIWGPNQFFFSVILANNYIELYKTLEFQFLYKYLSNRQFFWSKCWSSIWMYDHLYYCTNIKHPFFEVVAVVVFCSLTFLEIRICVGTYRKFGPSVENSR